jgi:hypothetical protein
MSHKCRKDETKRAHELAVFRTAFPKIPESEIAQPDQQAKADMELGGIGIELTRLHVDTGKDASQGSKLKAAEGREDRLLRKVKALAESSGVPPSHVKVLFGHHDTKSLDDLGPRVLSVLCEYMPQENESISLNWADHGLPPEIVRINILRNRSLTGFTVAPTRAGFVPMLTADQVKERIVVKESKAVINYSERWLLLEISGFAPSSLFDIGDEVKDHVYETLFDRIFIIERFSRELIELNTKRRNLE